MKQKFALLGIFLFAFLFGCSQVENDTAIAGDLEGYTVINEFEVGVNDFYELENSKGERFLYVEAWESTSLIQIKSDNAPNIPENKIIVGDK